MEPWKLYEVKAFRTITEPHPWVEVQREEGFVRVFPLLTMSKNECCRVRGRLLKLGYQEIHDLPETE